MPSHPDAIGYVNDLSQEVGEPWFKMVCDLAVVSGVSILDQQALDTLIALYLKNASYLGIIPTSPSTTTATTTATTTPTADFLEVLTGFANFKLLENTLHVELKKRITLIFGTNGSGKSSLCKTLKVLANPEIPKRPLHNVRWKGAVTPEFCYKFKSDASLQNWTQAVGYGPRLATVKYFDTGIAIKNVKDAVEPGRVIILTPFKIHIFEWVKVLTTKFREALLQKSRDDAMQLAQALEEIRKKFARFKGSPLSELDEKTVAVLKDQITIGERFSEQIILTEKQAAAVELEKATSEEGLKLIRAEHRELESFLVSIEALLDAASNLWALEPVTKAKILVEKQAEQEVLAKTLIPTGGTLDILLTLLRAASPLCKLESAASHLCPLCRQELGIQEIDLFKQYYELLAGVLEKNIVALKADIEKANELALAVSKVNCNLWDKYVTVQEEILASAKTKSDLIVANAGVAIEPSEEAKLAIVSLRALSATLADQLALKTKAIVIAAEGREELVKQRGILLAEIELLEYAQLIRENLELLNKSQRMASNVAFWESTLPALTPLLKKITDSAKKAHEELVVTDFESRLNSEYIKLTEKEMSAFGVKLEKKGSEASVTVLPKIGGKEIEGVLSEGEQRVHALALFFAELETCPQSVLVFDDPISSFDYNYIANYCSRLRDFTQAHPTSQIIVLTHNWEFFVQLQTTLNQAGLDHHLSVQILENCSVVADYSEKTDDLKNEIEVVLNAAVEPSKATKDEIAGKMRRLIEAVVNTHVFNHQRHQFKQKSQAISAFQSFTKIVPLLPAEATTLRDLYAKLSITEHDDPRNSYVNADKAMFQTRYNQILTVETAVIGRK